MVHFGVAGRGLCFTSPWLLINVVKSTGNPLHFSFHIRNIFRIRPGFWVSAVKGPAPAPGQ